VTYDGGGNVAQRTDTAGRVTSYVYDEMNRVVNASDADHKTTSFEYDALSRMTALVDAIGQRYRFNYDAVGRLKKMHRGPDLMSFTYDATGNRRTRTDYNGAVTQYAYDALNRLKTISYPDTTTVSYTYDKLSRLQTATNENGVVNFDYNKMNRMTTVTDVFGQVVDYNYDANGNRTKLSLNSTIVENYKYDTIDRLTKILDAAGAAFTFDYDVTNKLTQKKAPNGVKTTYQFDGLNRLIRLQDTKGSSILADRQYQYNSASQITQIAEPGITRNFGYDAVDRLTTASYTSPLQPNENYAYDGVGNRTASQLSASYSYQRFNRLANTSTANYSYDVNGNLISKTDSTGTTQYAWDFENRLRQVTLPSGMIVSYKYDALGRRIQRTPSTGVSTNFVYDGQDVIKDINSDGSTVEYLNGLGVDNKLRLTDSRLAGPLYFVRDHLGSTTGLTNSTGALVSQISYDSFGNANTGTSLTRYRYTGRECDSDTGLYYYRARWYDAKVGRFISEDPIGFGGGVNQFRYVGNNPQNAVDPSGLYNEDVHYYLTYFIATKFSCLTGNEARLIADADQSTDENSDTSPGPGFTITPVAWLILPNRFQQDKNAVFHTFNPGNDQFLKERWRVGCRGHVGLGRLLHYLQDTFSHGGFENPTIGQYGFNGVNPPVVAGFYVDNTNNDINKSADMARNTLFAIYEFAKKKDCKCTFTNIDTWWPQVVEFLKASNSDAEGKRKILDVPMR
jgi:RHS repeat-associated protein